MSRDTLPRVYSLFWIGLFWIFGLFMASLALEADGDVFRYIIVALLPIFIFEKVKDRIFLFWHTLWGMFC